MSFYRTKSNQLSYDKPIVATLHSSTNILLLLIPVPWNTNSPRYKWLDIQTGKFTHHIAQMSVGDAIDELSNDYTICNADLVVRGGN
jgi:hypothetical protein